MYYYIKLNLYKKITKEKVSKNIKTKIQGERKDGLGEHHYREEAFFLNDNYHFLIISRPKKISRQKCIFSTF